ncbi:hypothetical protein Tco_1442870, partial [Tanacetum coccineum]
MMESGDEQEDDNGGNHEDGNGNGNRGGNGNGNPNMNFKGFIPVAHECTYQDFLKCQPLNFIGTEGVVGLAYWFEKIETVFHIGNYPPRYQVKYASCTLLNSTLTWWNSHKKIVRADVDYAMTWKALMKLITKVYCPTKPTRLQDAIRIANNLMEKKLKGYAAKNAENKRRFDNNPRDNRGQQQPFKRQNVARAYTVGNNVKRKAYVGTFPYCNKSIMHHEGPCTMKCGNCKRVCHMTRDCKAAVTATTQRAPVGNQTGVTCYERGRQGHYRSECPKLKNQNRRNKTGNKTGNNEAKARAYAIGGGGANPDSNVITGIFLLNNRYPSMLFDSGADRSFVSTTFSALLDVVPSTLDVSYVVELADGRISETNVILRGCTLGLLGHPDVCDEKIVHIPYGDEVLIIEGDGFNGG